jgi:hypothetical protein
MLVSKVDVKADIEWNVEPQDKGDVMLKHKTERDAMLTMPKKASVGRSCIYSCCFNVVFIMVLVFRMNSILY